MQVDQWKVSPIKELYLGLYDGPHATPKPSDSGPVFLGIKNVTEDGRLDLSEVRHIAEDDYPNWTRRIEPRAGDIVFTYEATLNRYAVIPEAFRGCLGRRMALIRPNPTKVDTHFLYYYFFSAEWRKVIANNLLTGSTVDRIPLTRFPEFPVKLPPLPVQHQIADILSAYDALIENNLQRIRILEEMARSIYREWFVNFRFPGHENVSLVDSAFGQIPEAWEVGRLDDAFVLQRGFDLPKSSRSHGPNPVYAATGIVDFHAEIKARAPGVLTGRSGTIGEVLYVQQDYWPLNTTLWVKEFRKVEPLLAYYVLSMLDLKQFNSGAAVPTLNRNDIHGLPILIPPGKLQRQFQNIGGAMLSLAHNLDLACEKLRQTREVLLPRLLSETANVSCSDSPESLNSHAETRVELVTETQKRSDSVAVSTKKSPLTEAATQEKSGNRLKLDYELPSAIEKTDRLDVLAVIRQVFSDGQPRTRENAIRDVAQALGYGRVGNRIHDVLHTDLLTAVRRGILENVRGELQLLFRSIADYDRDFLKQQFLGALGRSWIERDEAIQNFCRWMGFRRTGPIIEETARSLINGLLRENRIEANDAQLIRRKL